MARIAVHTALLGGVLAALLAGCAAGPQWAAQPGYAPGQPATFQPAAYPNPTFVSGGDPQCFWETVVDVVDDYFPVAEERPVRVVGNTMTPGSIETFPQPSPTIFEPWRHDTSDPDQRVENTLQTMRRHAVVHVTPAQGGYWVEINVSRDLEDKIKPEHATAGAATLRYDSSLVGVINPVTDVQDTAGWIGKGRDTSLEQTMIGHLLRRCGQGNPPAVYRGQSPAEPPKATR